MRMFLLCLAVAMPAALEAKTRFQPYEGKDAISEGRGGTKLAVNGIDFWTSGTPPRRFQVLGMFVDRRGTGVLAGDAVGSKSVAAKAREIGGDAVIVMGQNTRVTGYINQGSATVNGNTASASGLSMPIEKATTQMIVVKYLPDSD